jgi:translation initiation factor 1
MSNMSTDGTSNNAAKIPTDGGKNLTQNAFAELRGLGGLDALGALQNPKPPEKSSGKTHEKPCEKSRETKTPIAVAVAPATPVAPATSAAPAPQKNRGRVDIVRETAGRGGKTVTVVRGFTGIGLPEKEALAKKMRAACGAGGSVKDGRIEIQGDKRDAVARILAAAGFRPVFAGG